MEEDNNITCRRHGNIVLTQSNHYTKWSLLQKINATKALYENLWVPHTTSFHPWRDHLEKVFEGKIDQKPEFMTKACFSFRVLEGGLKFSRFLSFSHENRTQNQGYWALNVQHLRTLLYQTLSIVHIMNPGFILILKLYFIAYRTSKLKSRTGNTVS